MLLFSELEHFIFISSFKESVKGSMKYFFEVTLNKSSCITQAP